MDDTLSVDRGATFVVALQSSPSTGYLWLVASLPAEVELVSESTTPVGAVPLAGGASEQRFTFRAAQAGSGVIEFVLKRPWEADILQREQRQIVVRAG